MATTKKKDKGFGDIMKGLKKNPALFIVIIIIIIILFVLVSNSAQGATSGQDSSQGLPNGTGGSSYYLVGAGDEYATGGPWDSFTKRHPGSYHTKKSHVSGKSHHDHTKKPTKKPAHHTIHNTTKHILKKK